MRSLLRRSMSVAMTAGGWLHLLATAGFLAAAPCYWLAGKSASALACLALSAGFALWWAGATAYYRFLRWSFADLEIEEARRR